jgi:uncharacterized protein (TIGR00725 family)
MIAVVGPGDADPAECAQAREIGRLLAERGCTVLTGGLGGVMDAAAEGAASVNGTAIGLLPGTDPGEAGPHHTDVVPTGLGEGRNALLVRAAEAVIAVGGSWGTLSEIALAMRTGTRVVLLGGWRVLDESGTELALPRAATPAEAVGYVLS